MLLKMEPPLKTPKSVKTMLIVPNLASIIYMNPRLENRFFDQHGLRGMLTRDQIEF